MSKKPGKSTQKPIRHQETDNEDDSDDSTESESNYDIDMILDKRVNDGQTEYLISWKGYPSDENSWVPVQDMNCPELIAEYEREPVFKLNLENPRWQSYIAKFNVRFPDEEDEESVTGPLTRSASRRSPQPSTSAACRASLSTRSGLDLNAQDEEIQPSEHRGSEVTRPETPDMSIASSVASSVHLNASKRSSRRPRCLDSSTNSDDNQEATVPMNRLSLRPSISNKKVPAQKSKTVCKGKVPVPSSSSEEITESDNSTDEDDSDEVWKTEQRKKIKSCKKELIEAEKRVILLKRKLNSAKRKLRQYRKRWPCPDCGRVYSSESGLSRHRAGCRKTDRPAPHVCPKCNKGFIRKDECDIHIKSCKK